MLLLHQLESIKVCVCIVQQLAVERSSSYFFSSVELVLLLQCVLRRLAAPLSPVICPYQLGNTNISICSSCSVPFVGPSDARMAATLPLLAHSNGDTIYLLAHITSLPLLSSFLFFTAGSPSISHMQLLPRQYNSTLIIFLKRKSNKAINDKRFRSFCKVKAANVCCCSQVSPRRAPKDSPATVTRVSFHFADNSI